MSLIVISGRAEVFAADGSPVRDPALLARLDGLVEPGDPISDHLDERLADADISGGDLRLVFEPTLGALKVVTTYEAPRKLRREELAALVEQTVGQWSDGIGENAFTELEAIPGGSVALVSDEENVEVVQRAGGTAKRPSPLHKAAERGDVAKIEKLLDAGEALEAPGRFGHTPLLAAVCARKLEAVRALLSRGADPNYVTNERQSALQTACMNGDLEIAAALIDAGAQLELRDDRGATPVYWAANRGFPSMVQLLRDRGADVNAADATGTTPLMIAQPDRLEVVELLLRLGADPLLRNAAGRTAAEEARAQAKSWRRDATWPSAAERAEKEERKAAFLDEWVRRRG